MPYLTELGIYFIIVSLFALTRERFECFDWCAYDIRNHGLCDRDQESQRFTDQPAAHRIQQLLDSHTRAPLLSIFSKKCSAGIWRHRLGSCDCRLGAKVPATVEAGPIAACAEILRRSV